MKKEILLAREFMQNNNLDALYIPTQDSHASEYPAQHYKLREHLSGFTGSAGELVITQEHAALFTDGRYLLQSKAQLAGSGIEPKIVRSNISSAIDFLNSSGAKILGADLTIISAVQARAFREAGLTLVHSDASELWQNRPPRPATALRYFNSGSISDRLADLRGDMNGGELALISALDDVAWLLGYRASDVEYCPVAYAYCLVSHESAILCTDGEITPALAEKLHEAGVTTEKYGGIETLLSNLSDTATLLIDSTVTCEALTSCTKAKIKEARGLVANRKTIKNKLEQEGFREAHLRDGAALTTFIYELKHGIAGETELSVSERLWQLRKAQGCFSPSFETISAYGEHGAIVHYAPTADTSSRLEKRSFILVDSGGHYPCGTTDVTRTIALGKLTEEEKRVFTLVLKGHIDLARAVFSEQTNGRELDTIARRPLQSAGLDFSHGTGHGVGHVLLVHEGPARISPSAPLTPIKAGTVISNEPGAYLAGKFGVRTENLLLCQKLRAGMLCFETLTLAPIDRDAIIVSLLTSEQRRWLNEYHARVYRELESRVSSEVKTWLKAATEEI